MRRPSLALGMLAGGLTSLPLVALSYLGRQLIGVPFFPFDVFDWLARELPGNVVTGGIEVIVGVVGGLDLGATSTAAKQIERLAALGIVALGGATVGAVILWGLRRTERPGWQVGAAAGVIVFLFVTAVEFNQRPGEQGPLSLIWLGLLCVSWGGSLGGLCQGLARSDAQTRADRRAAVAKIAGGTLGLALAVWGLGWLVERRPHTAQASGGIAPPTDLPNPALVNKRLGPGMRLEAARPVSSAVDDRIVPAPGTRPEITSNDDFYRVDINLDPLRIEATDWQLNVTGLVATPRLLRLSDLMAYPAVTQPATLGCISNPIGGDLIGNAYWTGVPLLDLLTDVGLQVEARYLFVAAADGFYETLPLQDMLNPRTLVVYAMNGRVLTAEHGHPVRICIPDRYGMKQPKWVIRLEATNRDKSGYWVDRGWTKAARPHIISIIDAVATDRAADGTVPVGGIAWAGGRGIRSVEVQVDDSAWVKTLVRTPPLGSLTWVQWRYDWPVTSGKHTFRVRATDGKGTRQIEKPSKAHPEGATGYHSLTVEVSS